MNPTCSRLLCGLASVSLAWSLTPVTGFAQEGEVQAPVAESQQGELAHEDATSVLEAQTSESSSQATGSEAALSDTDLDATAPSSEVDVANAVAEIENASSQEIAQLKQRHEQIDGEVDFGYANDDKESDDQDTGDIAATEQNDATSSSDEGLSTMAVEPAPTEVEVLEPEDSDIALRAQAASGWSRVWGAGALDTMQKVIQIGNVFQSNRGGTVLVATADGYWDALSASGLAGTLHAPVVLTSGSALSGQARSEIARLRPEHIVVLGGPVAISDGVVGQLKTLCNKVDRVWGENAAETATAIYRAGKGWGKTALIATTNGYWDALSAAPYAYWATAPIFLSGPDGKLPASAVDALAKGGFERIVIVGGPLAVPNGVESQLAAAKAPKPERKYGGGAIDTSAAFAKWAQGEGMTIKNLTVATSNGYWDALAAAPICGELASVLVLVSPDGNYNALDAVYSYAPGSVDHGYIIGGTLAVPTKVEKRVVADWALPSVAVSTTSMRLGGTVTVKPNLSPADADLSGFGFNYGWSRNGSYDNGEWDSTMKNGGKPTKDASIDYTFKRTGAYDVFIDAFGPDGANQTAHRTVAVYNFTGASATVRQGTHWYANAEIGVPGNRADGVEFRFWWKRKGADNNTLMQDWSSNPSVEVDGLKLGALNATYVITVDARDRQGDLGTKTVEVSPYKSGDQELDGIVAREVARLGGSGRDGLHRAYEYVYKTFSFQNMDRYPPGNWYDWAIGYAKDIYKNGIGNCYRYASLMCWLARAYGFDARVVSGQEKSGSGWIAHGWTVITLDGKEYIIDTQQKRERLLFGQDLDFFMTTYDTAPVYYRH